MRTEIIKKLEQIEQDFDVRILWAIESGSRSWGFESPDSDYDVRFVYVNKPQWYLSIEEKRDVIELPISNELDISGWDLRKALRLLKKSNAVLSEWLVSPYVYMKQNDFKDKLLEMEQEYFSAKSFAFHYLSITENTYKREIQNKNEVRIKKYFYVLRPLLNIFWLNQYGTIPPMIFRETVEKLNLPNNVKFAIDELLKKKAVTSELGKGSRIAEIDNFIDSNLAFARNYCDIAPVKNIDTEKLNSFFVKTIEDVWK